MPAPVFSRNSFTCCAEIAIPQNSSIRQWAGDSQGGPGRVTAEAARLKNINSPKASTRLSRDPSHNRGSGHAWQLPSVRIFIGEHNPIGTAPKKTYDLRPQATGGGTPRPLCAEGVTSDKISGEGNTKKSQITSKQLS